MYCIHCNMDPHTCSGLEFVRQDRLALATPPSISPSLMCCGAHNTWHVMLSGIFLQSQALPTSPCLTPANKNVLNTHPAHRATPTTPFW